MKQNNQTNLATGEQACRPQLIKRFVVADLSAAEQTQLEDHLDSCLACQTLIENETADSTSWSEAVFSLREDHDWDPLEFDESGEANCPEYVSKMVLRSLAPSDDPEMLGRLGPYEVSGLVGQGGMGVVLKAHDKSLNRLVALKVLRPFLAISGAARQRFFREARAAATINHDNVMPIHSVAESSSDLPYLVMPYVRGESLQQRIKKTGPFSPTETVRIGMQIASGLSAAHEQGLVHRDIKPANIILEEGVDKLWITDFGLARLIDDASLTRTGVIAGTPEYMSPEQARGESVDERSDLFSLGAVMYTMTTGHPPFRAETSYGVMRRITDDQPRPVREINSEVPAWLESFIGKLLSKSPEQRIGSSNEIANLLKGSLAHLQHPTAFELPSEVMTMAPRSTSIIHALNRPLAWAAALLIFAVVFSAMKYGSGWIGMASFDRAGSNPGQQDTGSGNSKIQLGANQQKQATTNQEAQINSIGSEQILPKNTSVWFSIRDPRKFAANFDETQIGVLLDHDSMKPFLNQFEVDFKKLMLERGVPIPPDICNRDWVTGEIGFGFADFPQVPRLGKRERGMSPIAMIQVGEDEEAAFDAVKADFAKLEKAKQTLVENARPGDPAMNETSYGPVGNRKKVIHGVSDGWLIISSDVHFARHMLANAKGQPNCLNEDPSFKKTMSRTRLNLTPDIIWFANPLKIVELVTALDLPVGAKRKPKDDWLGLLRREGFDLFTGVGGRIALATGDHEMLQRCFVCQSEGDRAKSKPGKFVERRKRANVLGLFDFSNKDAPPLTPPRWVPASASSCLIADWNKSSALNSFGPIYDAFMGEAGSFSRLLNDFKIDPDMQLDIERLAGQLDHRTTVLWHANKPGEPKTEHPVLGFKIKGDPKFVLKSVQRAVGGERVKILGYDAIVFQPADNFELAPVLEGLPENEEGEKPEALEPRFYVMAESQLLVSNNKDLIKRLLEKKNGKLVEAEDYIQVHAALGKLTDSNKVNIRHFGRLDLSLRYHYDLFRKGEFEWFKWIQRELGGSDIPKPKWVQRFDGSKLPKKFDKSIAPFLGTFGWVLETEDDGWLITGCILKKN